MRLAAIDVGTNSLHMIIAQAGPGSSFSIVDREKEMVRLGAGSLEGRELTESAMNAALQTLVRFKRLADSRQVDRVLAVATSAVREARNGGVFLRSVRQRTGIHVRVISGLQEARLIHDAAVHGVDVGSHRAVVLDIGGGSTEITLGTAAGARMARSFKLGVIRLTERYVRSDPPSRGDRRRLSTNILSPLDEYLQQIVGTGFERVIGTSGTILSIGALALGGASPPGAVHHATVSADRVRDVREHLTSLTMAERLRLPGLDSRRADLIVAGVVLLDTILERLGARELTLCDLSLREGLVLDYIKRHQGHIEQVERYPDIRRRSVIELGQRYHFEETHTRHVARLALALFDQTRSIHRLDDRAREWLEYGAILHDVGQLISYAGHHKHSYYLVKNGDLRGFGPEEIEMIALLTRYHRRAKPTKAHGGFAGLPGPLRKAVRTLSSMIRVAESLDRSRTQGVAELEVVAKDDDVVLRLTTREDVELEVWAATRHLRALEQAIGQAIRIEVQGQHDAKHVDHSAPVPRKAARGGRHRRLGKDDAGRAARQVARRPGASRVPDRVELVAARQGRHPHGQKEKRPDADDVQPPARH